MLVKDAVSQAKALTGAAVDDSVLCRWLSEMDGQIAFEFYRTDAWLPYTAEDDKTCELLVPFPWDRLYIHHLEAMTYYTNGEYDRYKNARVMSEKVLDDYRKYITRTHVPVYPGLLSTDGGSGATVITGGGNAGLWYALSAYALAVKHGFQGSEEAWLESLGGMPGKDGRDGVTGNIHVYDIGSAAFDIATLDFSTYDAGDVILVVSDMEGA